MTNVQLYLAIGIPCFTILISILGTFLSNRGQFKILTVRLDSLEKRLEDGFSGLEKRLDELMIDVREIRNKVSDHGERIAKLEAGRR